MENNTPKTPEEKKKEKKNFAIGCLTLIVIIIALYFVFSPSKEKEMEYEAYRTAQTHVEKHLKAPATATFPKYDKQFIQSIGTNGFEINSYVDSQNGFGAMIRSNYKIIMHKNGDNWICDYFEVNGKQIQ